MVTKFKHYNLYNLLISILGQSLKAYQFGNDSADLLCVDGIVETIKELVGLIHIMIEN